jgi:hypothetical protein
MKKSTFGFGILWLVIGGLLLLGFYALIPQAECALLDYRGIVLAVVVSAVATALSGAVTLFYIRDNDRLGEFVVLIFTVYLLVITLFALLFLEIGIHDTVSGRLATGFLNYLYFSAVTFTTLGYGDLLPCEESRVYAAIEAVFGGFFMPFSSAIAIALVIKSKIGR